MRASIVLAPFAAVLMLAACAPQPGAPGAQAATHRSYEEPNTGSLFGGDPNAPTGNGANDPGMGYRQNGTGGH